VKIKATDYVTVDEGEYPARFAGYEERTTEFGDAVQFKFVLLDEEHSGVEIRGLASKKLSPKSKMRGWVEGMIGRVLEPGEEIDLDDMIDRKVMLYLAVEDTDKGLFNRIEKIRVPKRKAPAKPVVEEEDEEEAPARPVKAAKRQPLPETEAVPF
jgi:hypothetical protein